MEYKLTVGPLYDAVEDASTTADVNVPVTAGPEFAVTGVTVADPVALKPGGRVPVHWKAEPDVALSVVSPVGQAQAAERPTRRAMIVMLFNAYALDEGLVVVNVTAVAALNSVFGAAERVGRLAFPAACTGTASGTRNSIPDSASNA